VGLSVTILLLLAEQSAQRPVIPSPDIFVPHYLQYCGSLKNFLFLSITSSLAISSKKI
jgi:hypothetical protein